ncbi:MAG TPA: magnesium/cobalt transporter CorA [Verrucomicrobiae bacterium]|nr:magnesium/cobalt transporter CorA [Verrucomicrobiae bacterium]
MLVSCVAYQNGKKVADISETQIHDYVARPDCFVWVALREPDPAQLAQMKQAFDLHPLAVEDARNGHQRPKIEEYGDSLFAVLHMIELTDKGALRVGEVDVFVGRNYVLSVRTGVEKGFQEVRERSEREPELLQHGASYVLYALMDAVVDRYFPVLDALEAELENIEERIFAGGNARRNLKALYGLKQKLVTTKHAVAPLLEAVGKLYGGRVPSICANLQDYFRDISDHLVRLNQTIDSIRDMVITAISVNLSMITLEESQTMKQLAAYAALVAVPTLIAGIYGMNFDHMPELRWLFGYPAVLTLMAAIDGYLFYKLRKARWL